MNKRLNPIIWLLDIKDQCEIEFRVHRSNSSSYLMKFKLYRWLTVAVCCVEGSTMTGLIVDPAIPNNLLLIRRMFTKVLRGTEEKTGSSVRVYWLYCWGTGTTDGFIFLERKENYLKNSVGDLDFPSQLKGSDVLDELEKLWVSRDPDAFYECCREWV